MLRLIIFAHFLTSATFGDVSQFFENDLSIIGPSWTLFPGDLVNFTCIAKNYSGKFGRLIWHWHFNNMSEFYAEIFVEPENDSLEYSSIGLVRKSQILIPEHGGIFYIGCELENEGKQKLIPVDILENQPQQRGISSFPQITLELFGADSKMSRMTLVTNRSLTLSPHVKSFVLTCFVPSSQKEQFEWDIYMEPNFSKTLSSPSTSFLLNKLALIYREALISGRIPQDTSCAKDANETMRRRDMFPGTDTSEDRLQVIISPSLNGTEARSYRCLPRNGTFTMDAKNAASVSITQLATRMQPQSERDEDFLALINVLMQILQSSGSAPSSAAGAGDGGGSGPLYGVGFGSSTIMILMGLTIFYLKRQLSNLQEEVSECEQRKKLKRKSTGREKDDDAL